MKFYGRLKVVEILHTNATQNQHNISKSPHNIFDHRITISIAAEPKTKTVNKAINKAYTTLSI